MQGGGVFDPSNGLKIVDFSGNIAPDKLLKTMGQTAQPGSSGRKGTKKKKKIQDGEDPNVEEAMLHRDLSTLKSLG